MHTSSNIIRAGRFDVLRATIVGALLLGEPCCASVRPCPPLGQPHTQFDRPAKVTHEPSAAHAPLQRLATSVEAIECTPTGLDAGAASEAFSDLADALDLRKVAIDMGSQEIRNDAHALAAKAAPAKAPRDAVRDALSAALQTLLARSAPAQRQLEYRNTVGALARSVASVSAAANDGDSCNFVIDALREATDAVFLALAGEPPFEDQRIGAGGPPPLTSMRAGLEPARAAVLALGEASWQDARSAAAQALQTLAAMVRAGDCAGTFTNQQWSVRFEAGRLTRSDALSFGQVRWIKGGLGAALDGLDADTRRMPTANGEGDRTPTGSALIASARKAVANIDGNDLFGFQRPAIQDAFRATLDAFAVVAQPMPDCPK